MIVYGLLWPEGPHKLDQKMSRSQPCAHLELILYISHRQCHPQKSAIFLNKLPRVNLWPALALTYIVGIALSLTWSSFWYEGLPLRLAPMAVCLPTVVAEFAKLTAGLGLMECGPWLPDTAEAARCQRPLEMFFPFDPYLLRRSASFLDLRRTFLRQFPAAKL